MDYSSIKNNYYKYCKHTCNNNGDCDSCSEAYCKISGDDLYIFSLDGDHVYVTDIRYGCKNSSTKEEYCLECKHFRCRKFEADVINAIKKM